MYLGITKFRFFYIANYNMEVPNNLLKAKRCQRKKYRVFHYFMRTKHMYENVACTLVAILFKWHLRIRLIMFRPCDNLLVNWMSYVIKVWHKWLTFSCLNSSSKRKSIQLNMILLVCSSSGFLMYTHKNYHMTLIYSQVMNKRNTEVN